MVHVLLLAYVPVTLVLADTKSQNRLPPDVVVVAAAASAVASGWSWAPWKTLGVRSRKRTSGAGASPRTGERLFKPLACLRATNYDPFEDRGL